MKLFEYKAKVIVTLLNYEPKNQKEAFLIDNLIHKVRNLRNMTLANVLSYMHLCMREQDVTNEFISLIKSIIPKPEEVEELLRE